jgi:hypothetical protein
MRDEVKKDRVNAELQHAFAISKTQQVGVPALDTAKPQGEDGLAGLSANRKKAPALSKICGLWRSQFAAAMFAYATSIGSTTISPLNHLTTQLPTFPPFPIWCRLRRITIKIRIRNNPQPTTYNPPLARMTEVTTCNSN